ncbi:hypothetical protein ScPMuIL_018992 [Solemya velum]
MSHSDSKHGPDCHSCGGHQAVPSVSQTLDEMEFERGIWSAALNDDVDGVVRQLDKGIDVNTTDSAGYTALHYSSRSGFNSVCTLLLKRGANVNCVTRSGGVTPLHRAAYCGHIDTVEILLNSRANPMLRDGDGKVPLHKAIENSQFEVVQRLLSVCPESAHIADNKGRTAWDYSEISDELRQLLSKHR